MFPVVVKIVAAVAVLAVLHLALDWWLRWTRARRLAQEHAEGLGGQASREDYVARGMAAYERSWERRLLAAIYVVPALIAVALLLLANYG